MLSDRRASQQDRALYLEMIQRNGDYLLTIINDVLDLSKIEAGKMSVERVACSPVELTAEVASLMRARALGKGLTFAAEYQGAIPERIQADPTRVRQILVNVVGNAIKFTEVGGVRLVIGMESEGPANRPRLQIDVTDSGIGMTDEQRSRLFKPFEQADSSMSRRFGGTGLGLAISKRLAEALGGTLTVRSAVGKGSTFTLTLETGSLDGVAFVSPSINDGFVPSVEALAALDATPVDVVVTDASMAGMNGFELCGRIVTNHPDLPVMLLTAFGTLQAATTAIRVGACDFLIKPPDIEDFVDALDRAVRSRRLRGEVKRLMRSNLPRIGEILTGSPAMEGLCETLARVAESDASVLITARAVPARSC